MQYTLPFTGFSVLVYVSVATVMFVSGCFSRLFGRKKDSDG